MIYAFQAVPEQLSKAFDIQRLRVLVEVARRGSVTAAAEELRLSQPTVSLHVKALNMMLGVPVVERRGRGVRLTDAGRVLEEHARRALAELERAQEAMERHRGVAGGSLHLGAGTTPGTYLLPRLLGEFHARHPDVDLRLEVASTSGIVELIRRGELHLGVVGETAPHRDIEQRPLVRDRLVCIVPVAHAAAERGEITKRELADATLLVRGAGSSSQAVTDRWLERSRLQPRSRWELDSPEAIKQAVAAGLGVAFVSELIVRDELQHGRLAAVGVESARLPERTLDLVRSAGQGLSPPERAFIELLDERLP